MTKRALEVRHMSKTFGGIKAVNDLSFHVGEHETVSIIGPNGAGKTTVFNLITGFYTPDAGMVDFFGQPITGVASYRLARMGIARTFQNIRLFTHLSVMENIAAAASGVYGCGFFPSVLRTKSFYASQHKIIEKVRILLDFFGLREKEHEMAANLPYGEQRKLELARALALEPKIILVDEPGAGMNPSEIQDFSRLIAGIKASFSLTLVIIEHQMDLVMSLSDRIVVMDFGEKIMDGSPLNVKKDARVIEAYLGGGFNASR